ncbi:hypothetical protein [Endozoicomonas elysicola]|uniref:hypothetical protein n=1 Tax=Endozoicomonas elysicola TaxID=305900 RepID=UPI0013623F74|nr:hypothetical protein [Endozoicomonas elysicola]
MLQGRSPRPLALRVQVRAWESDGESVGVVGELGVSIEIVPPDGLHAATALRNTMGKCHRVAQRICKRGGSTKPVLFHTERKSTASAAMCKGNSPWWLLPSRKSGEPLKDEAIVALFFYSIQSLHHF